MKPIQLPFYNFLINNIQPSRFYFEQLSLLRKSLVQRLALILIVSCLSFSNSFSQGYISSDDVRSKSSANINYFSGLTTITFPVNEDGACPSLNIMRWMDIFVVDANNNETLIAKLEKSNLNVCGVAHTTTTNFYCFAFDMCDPLPGTTLSLSNGIGGERIANLTVPNLPDSLSTIKFVGQWDTDWFEVGNNFDIDYSIALINGGRAFVNLPGLLMTTYNLPLEGKSSICNPGGVIGPIACEHADCPDYATGIHPFLNDPDFFSSLRAVSSTKGGPYTSALWLKPAVVMTSYVVDVTYTGKDNLTGLVDHQVIHDEFEQQGTINQEFSIPFTWRPTVGTNVGFIYVRVKLLDGNTVVGDYESWFKVFNEGPTSLNASVIDVTQTPIIPRWVIYKPPGDKSTSSFNLSTEVCRDFTTTVGSEKTYDTDTDITLGLVVSVGEYATIDIGFGFTGSFGFESGESFSDSESLQTCTKITNGFNTEDLYGDEAADSDLIIGISKRQVIAQDSILFLGSDCQDSIVNQLYIYTVDDGSTQLSAKSRSRLTEERDALMDIVDAYFANPSPTAADTLLALESKNQIDVYNQFFDQIAISEAAALANPPIGLADPEPNLAWERNYELSTNMSFSYSYNSVKTTTSGIGGFVTFAGTGFESKQNWEWSETYGEETTENTASVEMIDYVIQDGEDMVIVDIYRNEVFGTPLFRLRPDSRTSCPYEGGILRNKPTLGLPAHQSECAGIAYLSTDASNAIELPLDICNKSSEERDYKIRLKSNTNNAKITIGSELVVDGTTIAFSVPANDCYTDGSNNPQLMLIERRANSNLTEATIVLEIVPDCFEDDLSDEFNELETSELEINITFNQDNTNGDDEECETDRLYVDNTATGDGTGRTWNNAFNYLQDAIAASVSGDTICVAAGEYYPCFGANQPDDETASFSLKNGVVMLGGFAGTESPTFDVNQRDIRSNETVLSGEACGSYHVVYNTNLNNTAVLDGFSITRGVAQNSPTDPNGGGIYNDNSSPVIKNCFIHRNQADVGAGIYNINNSNPTITNCNFMKNYAFSTGGAIAIAGSTPTISYCSFSGNTGVVNGPAIRVFSSGNVNVSHSIFWGNGSGSGVTNIDILYSAGSGTCDYCIIDADGGSTYPGIGGLNQDPLFVEASPEGPIWNIGGDLRLQSGSPAIDFLVDPSGPMTDQDGKLRPFGAGHDIGAYEYGMSISDMDNDGISDLTDLCPDDKDTALNFDGINDYVLLPNESNFDITGAITVEAWIKVDEFDIPNQGIVTKGNNTWRITRNWINSTIRFSLSGVWEIDGTIEVDDNLWHHIAGVYDGSVMSLYIDGIVDISSSRTGSIVTTDDPVTIGSDILGGNPARFFDGSIDDVMIWNRALSPLEIQNSMAAPIDPTAPGLVAYYQFNDALACITSSQTTAVDAGPLANTGTLMNFSLANDCVSNWSSGRNLDSDGDGIGDACDDYDYCPDNLANLNTLSGDVDYMVKYETSGLLESQQHIISPADVQYDSGLGINLLSGFEVNRGAVFHAYIDGCGNQ